MNFIETNLKGCFIIEPNVFYDGRGYFLESYNKNTFKKGIGSDVDFIQDNRSLSSFGVLRGLHFQKGNDAQSKLVMVLSGKVLDVVVDIRPDSSTFGQYFTVELSSENKKQLFIPRGFAHGFVVLSDSAEFFYKVDNYYAPKSEAGILYCDPELNIDWRLAQNELIINSKDLNLPSFKDVL